MGRIIFNSMKYCSVSIRKNESGRSSIIRREILTSLLLFSYVVFFIAKGRFASGRLIWHIPTQIDTQISHSMLDHMLIFDICVVLALVLGDGAGVVFMSFSTILSLNSMRDFIWIVACKWCCISKKTEKQRRFFWPRPMSLLLSNTMMLAMMIVLR